MRESGHGGILGLQIFESGDGVVEFAFAQEFAGASNAGEEGRARRGRSALARRNQENLAWAHSAWAQSEQGERRANHEKPKQTRSENGALIGNRTSTSRISK